MSKALRNPFHLAQIIILFVGGGFIIAYATALRDVWWGLTLNTLGTALIGATLLSILQSAFGIDLASVLEKRLKLNQDIHDMGLIAIHTQLGDETIFNRFTRATTLDLLFASGKNTFHRHLNRIESSIVEHGCNIRVLICNQDNPIFSSELLADTLCPNVNLQSEVEEVKGRVRALIKKLKESDDPPQTGSIELRLFNSIPTGSIIIVDSEIARFTPYLPYAHSSAVPSYDFISERGNTLFSSYQAAFEVIWGNAITGLIADFSLADSSSDSE